MGKSIIVCVSDCVIQLTDNLDCLSDVQVAEKKLFLVQGRKPQLMNWEQFGLRIGIEEDSLLSSETVEVATAALVGGQFKFPKNTVLVSAVYAVSVSKPLLKPLRLEMQHCVDLRGRPGLSQYLKFAMAPVSTPSLPYQFSLVEGGEFTSNSWYGAINRKDFCLVCILGLEMKITGDGPVEGGGGGGPQPVQQQAQPNLQTQQQQQPGEVPQEPQQQPGEVPQEQPGEVLQEPQQQPGEVPQEPQQQPGEVPQEQPFRRNTPGATAATRRSTPGATAATRSTPGSTAATRRSTPGATAATRRSTPGATAATRRSTPGATAATRRSTPGATAATRRSTQGATVATRRSTPGATAHEPQQQSVEEQGQEVQEVQQKDVNGEQNENATQLMLTELESGKLSS